MGMSAKGGWENSQIIQNLKMHIELYREGINQGGVAELRTS